MTNNDNDLSAVRSSGAAQPRKARLTKEQMDAAHALSAAHRFATNSGLFDLLNDNCKSPRSINDVCDALDWFIANRMTYGKGENA